MKQILVAILALAFFLIGIGGFQYFRTTPAPLADGIRFVPDDSSYNRTYWTHEIAEKGPGVAYALFKELNAAVSGGRNHIAGHVFGKLLYEAEGAQGITVCDTSFGFSCFHGFFLAAVASEGTVLIAPLDAACVSAFGPLGTGCQHGIGHGILEYLGHDRVNEALNLCAQTTEKVPLLGCSSGVFMEYFHRTGFLTADGTSPDPLPFDSQTPYGPCASVLERYRSACYWALPTWWQSAVEGESLEHMAGRCAGLAGDSRESCYLGVGDLVPSGNSFDASASRDTCDAVVAGDEDAGALCRAGAA